MTNELSETKSKQLYVYYVHHGYRTYRALADPGGVPGARPLTAADL